MIYAKAITPSDTVNLGAASHIYVVGAGNVAVVTEGGDEVTFKGLSAGSTIQVYCNQVKSTGTTATNLLALY